MAFRRSAVRSRSAPPDKEKTQPERLGFLLSGNKMMKAKESRKRKTLTPRLPAVAIVGRPNVGKSTLFNRIVRQQKALVDDEPGVTRDRIYARTSWNDYPFLVVDTGGFLDKGTDSIEEEVKRQALAAIEEADVVIFVGDAKAGSTPEDSAICRLLREGNKPVIYAINKVDGPEQEQLAYDFYELGIDEIIPVSAAHGYGFRNLMQKVVRELKRHFGELADDEESEEIIRLAIVGRPNAGKSSLINRLVGDERCLVSSEPGTTRDSIDTEIEFRGVRYQLIDTAGIRRKGRTREKIEKVSVIKAIQSIERCHVAVLLIDGELGVTDQDCRIAGYISDRSRACIVAINKADLLKKDRIKSLTEQTRYALKFMPYAPIITVSALTGEKIFRIFPLVNRIYEQYRRRIPTGKLNQFFEEVTFKHEPPMYRNRRIKFFYATQATVAPPTFVIFCNHPDGIHFSYRRYLTNEIRKKFSFDLIPIRLIFRARS